MDFRALPPQRRQGIGRSHAGPGTRFGKRRSDRFAIFCQPLQLLERDDFGLNRGGFPNQRCSDSACWLGRRPVWMGKPYSMDLRERAVGAVLKEGLSRHESAARFGVAPSTVIN